MGKNNDAEEAKRKQEEEEKKKEEARKKEEERQRKIKEYEGKRDSLKQQIADNDNNKKILEGKIEALEAAVQKLNTEYTNLDLLRDSGEGIFPTEVLLMDETQWKGKRNKNHQDIYQNLYINVGLYRGKVQETITEIESKIYDLRSEAVTYGNTINKLKLAYNEVVLALMKL
ncbi:MAG: DUF5082 family protein [Lachnospiraceae bacterium]|nr:DUF5082 family protein [Lachnospiraceae bacterium]